MYYRRDGTPYTGLNALQDFGRDFVNMELRRVGFDSLSNGLEISTVWMGLDHNFGGGRPLIFETMVFANGRGSDFNMARYSTLEEARLGHKMFVKKYSVYKTADDVLGRGSSNG